MTEFTQFSLAIDKGVALVTFNRPEKMNTFNPLVMKEMIGLFDVTDADDSIGAVVITGSGKAFCAGAELGTAGGDTFNYNKRDSSREEIVNGVRRDGGGRVTLRIFNSLKPVIAACNGAAVGVGATMQLAMDFRLASTNARYGFVFARRGIVPEACSSWFLPRLVGVPTALEWIYSGRVFDAQEAKDKGLVQSLHAPDDLLPAAMEFARKLTEKTAPVAVAVSRRMVWTMLGAPHPMYAHRVDSRGIQTRGASADVKEGVESFMEKRDAHFPNKVSSDMPDIFPPEPQFE
ncbi:MAG TPA: crotonase/enoyl-CoA hydratase family protein [Hyphomonadaceae bacterium]|nr:crotonase/enoyl-CoA hydratase family protein [Hyphomonadaceae bacterium]